MRFATLSHLMDESDLQNIPTSWIKNDIIISPEITIQHTSGYVIGIKRTPKEIMYAPRDKIRRLILEAVMYAHLQLEVDIIQLGALITSVTSGGTWLVDQDEYRGYVTHGDSYTAAVTCQAALKAVAQKGKKPDEITLAIIGPYGIIGEATSKILVSEFNNTILIGRRMEKLNTLIKHLSGSFEVTVDLNAAKQADLIITATSHPEALLTSAHLKKDAIVIDVSQPANLTQEVCEKRPDITRIDGGVVDFPDEYVLPIPHLSTGKNLACITELIMQALEDERSHHVGSINLKHLKKTEQWAEKYGFTLNELTNFGQPIS